MLPNVRSEVLTMVVLKIQVVWDVTLCWLVSSVGNFRGLYWLIQCGIFGLQFTIHKYKTENHRTIIVPCCLYGWGTSSLTLSKKHRLRVFKNRVLWKIFGPKRDRVTKEWRRQHNKKLYDLYFSPNIIQVIKPRSLRWLGYVACMRDCMVAIQCYWGNLRKKITWRT